MQLKRAWFWFNKNTQKLISLCILIVIYFLGIGMAVIFSKLFGVKRDIRKGWISRKNMKKGLLEEMF
ncbi:hypothetical protein KKC08_03795 [Patescibacteria group bacterium]|nr:hypothetical protein [Patescibacteria group bacterium]MCG2702015.1 hypothetical protein [Candidatus Parcubacteria bacterium]MBU4265535.1 hypothetical protein [Patescibacteria group bacterium]MBU4389864.1 hypothetical protein [Patescibacteria group bacterium]MBU4397263.1 hypothetical protein [Patescibacteria group bacterium]